MNRKGGQRKIHHFHSPDYRYTKDFSPVIDNQIIQELDKNGFIPDEIIISDESEIIISDESEIFLIQDDAILD